MKLKRFYLALLGFTALFLLAGCQSGSGFNQYFIDPFVTLIHFTAFLFSGSYGIAIIVLTLAIRLVLAPLMMKQYMNQHHMRKKMEIIKPEMQAIKKKLKATKDPDEQRNLQTDMMALYKKHQINPLSIGCLPMIIQMPILMGFYYAIRGSKAIASHTFLWFSLGHPDVILTIIAGVAYYLQFKINQGMLPDDQQQSMRWMGLISPAMIVFFSLQSPAALPLYWTVGGLFLVAQTYTARLIIERKEQQQLAGHQ